MHAQFLLLDEQAEHQRLELGIGVPVDAAEVVALHVGAEVGKLDRCPVNGAPPLAPRVAAEQLLGNKGEHLEFLEEGGIEERFRHMSQCSRAEGPLQRQAGATAARPDRRRPSMRSRQRRKGVSTA